MEEPPAPPKKPVRVISQKRQEILDMAFAQLKKSRASLDPGLINKIRRMIAGNPAMMKALGLSDSLTPDPVVTTKKEPPLTKALENKPVPLGQEKGGYEKIDQAKNMEVMAKLMALNPQGRDKIKSAIKKATD